MYGFGWFFFLGQGPCLNLFQESTVCTEAYLTQAAHGSQSASLELLLSSHCFACTYDSTLLPSNISCPLGPCVPAVVTCLAVQAPHPPNLLLCTLHHPALSLSTPPSLCVTVVSPPVWPVWQWGKIWWDKEPGISGTWDQTSSSHTKCSSLMTVLRSSICI